MSDIKQLTEQVEAQAEAIAALTAKIEQLENKAPASSVAVVTNVQQDIIVKVGQDTFKAKVTRFQPINKDIIDLRGLDDKKLKDIYKEYPSAFVKI
jgi:hypothetical protein